MLTMWFLPIKACPICCSVCSASQEIRVTRLQPKINPLACCICWTGLLGRVVSPPWNEGPNFGSYTSFLINTFFYYFLPLWEFFSDLVARIWCSHHQPSLLLGSQAPLQAVVGSRPPGLGICPSSPAAASPIIQPTLTASGAQQCAGPTCCKVLCLRANKEVEGTGFGHQFDVGDRKEGEFQGYILVSVRMLGWVVEPLWAASLAETCQHVLGCRVD